MPFKTGEAQSPDIRERWLAKNKVKQRVLGLIEARINWGEFFDKDEAVLEFRFEPKELLRISIGEIHNESKRRSGG